MPFPPDAPLPQTPPQGQGRLPLHGLTVLVVDDSRFTCDALRLILQRAGARLRRAESLEIARLHLAFHRPDLAIVDLGLPDGRGQDLIAELALEGLPVLGLSGDPEGRETALDAGATGFLEKPIGSVAALVRLIRQLATGAGPLERGQDTAPPPADPMALRDDLVRASGLIAGSGDPGYAQSFLRSLARAAGDPALEAAAQDIRTAFDRAKLVRMIEDRVASLGSMA
ncbi:response regulator [Tabrizicola sp.]|uniref:response regulator n=1 Tax=Tabrizicola sp. TaxID=2005166 RepID=UPI002FDCE35A